jgi:hypothetical protein
MQYAGSHRVTDKGDRVVIHDLELFSGFDPAIDVGDAEMREYDAAKVRAVVARTQQFMARGQNPRIVLRHDRPGRNVEPDSRGEVTSLKAVERGQTVEVLGDVEMARSDFDALIASNRYPRRSAEISKVDGHMANVALLGREPPRRPIRDTRFSREDQFDVFEAVEVTTFGTDQPYVPEFKGKASKKDKHMEEIERLREENAGLKAQLASVKCEKDGAFADFERRSADFEAERKAASDRIAALECAQRTTECEREIDQMEKDGYAVAGEVRKALVAQLQAAPDRAAAVTAFRSICRKVEPGRPLTFAAERPSGNAGKVTAAEVVEFQRIAGDDAAKFKSLMEKRIAG